jgi:drug/metabolite transporter (DMT)-like permease
MRSARRFIPAVLAMAFWATNFAFSPVVLDAVGAIQLTGSRWFIAIIVLIPLALITEKVTAAVIVGEWKIHVVQALLGYVGYTLLLYFALGVTSPVTASVLVALNPATIAIAARFVLHENMSVNTIVGIAISIVGALVVVFGGGIAGGFAFSYGDVLLLIATVLWTAYSMLAPRVKTPPITATAVQATISGIIMIPVMALDIAWGNTAWFTMDGSDWLGVLWIGLIPSAGAYFLWNISSDWIGPTRTGAFLNIIPVFTALFVVAFGGSVTLTQVLGGALVLAGVSYANRTAKTVK